MSKTAVLVLVASSLILTGCSLGSWTAQQNNGGSQPSSVSLQTGGEASPAAAMVGESAPAANYQTGMSLTVTTPADGMMASSPTLTVSGKTVPNVDVSVNDQDLTADSDGNFSATITLDDGSNAIWVIANDQNGNSAEKDLTVTYNAPNTQVVE